MICQNHVDANTDKISRLFTQAFYIRVHPCLSVVETMAFLNDNFLKLKAGYLFPEIGGA